MGSKHVRLLILSHVLFCLVGFLTNRALVYLVYISFMVRYMMLIFLLIQKFSFTSFTFKLSTWGVFPQVLPQRCFGFCFKITNRALEYLLFPFPPPPPCCPCHQQTPTSSSALFMFTLWDQKCVYKNIKN